MSTTFNPNNVNLTTADPAQVVCFLQLGQNEYNGKLAARISAIFVILVTSTFTTLFPYVFSRSNHFKIPLYVYLFARYFGAGVIVATAFIHLLDPAYTEIGPQSCVGMTGNWSGYSWPPAIVLVSVMSIFLIDFAAERYVEVRYGVSPVHHNVGEALTDPAHANHVPRDVEIHAQPQPTISNINLESGKILRPASSKGSDAESFQTDLSFRQQIAAFFILEFGVVFHSIIIGLNLGTAGKEFKTLYPVIIFHQAFEGLGLGARLSAIPFPKQLRWLPWALSFAYGTTTPIAIAIGLGLRTTYNSGSFIANVVSGIFDSLSAGILIYTGLVELLARDFLFNPTRTTNNKELTMMIVSTLLGAGIMALLGKWA